MSPARATALALCVLTAGLLAGCRGPDWRIVQLYGGAGSVEAIETPTKVAAFRIEPGVSNADPGVERVGLHKALSGPVEVDENTSAELAGLLMDPDTYDWLRAKGCEFRPGVGLRFTRDVSHVDIALCFECDMLTIHRQGRRVGVEDFDDARPELVAIAKRLFPGDADIQALEP